MSIENNVIPLLANTKWSRLISSNLISNNLQINGFNISLYKPILNIDFTYNLLNSYVPKCASYIWLIDAQYVDPYLLNNMKYLSKNFNNIKKVVIGTDINSDVCKYWNKGFRQFILDTPSNVVAKVQKHKYNGGFFLCTRATNPNMYLL